jgi:hypothetical protein
MSETIGSGIYMDEVIAQAKRITNKGPDDKRIKPSDYDVAVGDLKDKGNMIATLKDRLRMAAEHRQPHEVEWRRAFMAWHQQLDTDKEASWESQRYLPMILQHVETALPNITSAVFNRRRVFAVDGNDPHSVLTAGAIEALLDWQIKAQVDMEPTFDKAMWYATLLGTGYIDTGWSYETATAMQPTVVLDTDENGEVILNEYGFPKKAKVMREKETTVKDWPHVRAPNPMDIWMAPYSEAGDDADWFFEYRVTTLGRLRNQAGNGHIDADALNKWIKRRKEHGKDFRSLDEGGMWESASTRLWDSWMTQVGYSERPVNSYDDWHDNDQEVIMCCYRSKSENITILDGDWIVGYSKQPYLHGKTGLVNHQFYPVPGSPYGRGLGTILLGHQELVNENMNRYMDSAALSLMAPIIVNRNSVSLLDKNFVWEPNALIHARDVNNGAKRLEMPAPTNIALQVDGHIKKDADDTSGFGEQMRGLATPGVGTATEFKGIQQNIQNRAYMHVRRLQQTMSRVGTLLCQLNQQFMTEEQMVKVVGQKGIDYKLIKPWELVGNVRITCTADPNRASPEVDMQQLIGAVQVALPLLTGQAGPAGPKIARVLFEEAGLDNVEEIIPDDPGNPRDPIMENVALEGGFEVMPHEREEFAIHIQAHTQRMQQLEEEGATPQTIDCFKNHIQATLEMATQQQQQAQGGGQNVQNPQPSATQGVQPGQVQGQAQGAAGVPGQASPGPAAPAGRPLPR